MCFVIDLLLIVNYSLQASSIKTIFKTNESKHIIQEQPVIVLFIDNAYTYEGVSNQQVISWLLMSSEQVSYEM